MGSRAVIPPTGSSELHPVFQQALAPFTAGMRWTWRNAPDLMERLTRAQNALKTPIDIVTFAGFCDSRAELEAHVVRYEDQVAAQ